MESTGRRGVSAAVLKNVAVITMTIDHVTAFIVKAILRSQGTFNLYTSDEYTLGRVIGRIAFVLYAFMIAEGAVKTRNRWKYALRLLILAIVSIVPHSYVNAKKLWNPADLNIFFLLLLGLLTIYAYEWLKNKIPNQALSVIARLCMTAASCAIALLCNFEYGMMGILLILSFYVFRDDFPHMALAVVLVMSFGYMAHVILKNGGIAWISQHSASLLRSIWNTDRIQIYGLLALPLIYFYNGSKGKQLPKAFYYLFYPVHLAIIALILEVAF